MSGAPHPVAASLNGAFYEIPCGPGEAPRVRELAQRLDQRMRAIAAASGAADNAQLMLLAALTLEDECEAAVAEVQSLRTELERLRNVSPDAVSSGARDRRLAEALLNAAERVSSIAEKLDAA